MSMGGVQQEEQGMGCCELLTVHSDCFVARLAMPAGHGCGGNAAAGGL